MSAIPLAIRAEFERRRAQGQAGVDARRMDRDVVNRSAECAFCHTALDLQRV
jgi:hypothetical protein